MIQPNMQNLEQSLLKYAGKTYRLRKLSPSRRMLILKSDLKDGLISVLSHKDNIKKPFHASNKNDDKQG